MKSIFYTLISFFFLASCVNHQKPEASRVNFRIDTSLIHYFSDSIPCFVDQIQLDSILENLSANNNFLFIDMYPVMDTLPEISADTFILAVRLEKLGFVQTGGGNGNWEHGPRFRYREYENDSLHCRIYKAYLYHEADKDSCYNLLAYEQIECRKKEMK